MVAKVFWGGLEGQGKEVGHCSLSCRISVMTFKMPAIKRKSVSHRHLSLHFTRLGVRAHRGPLCVLAYVGTSKAGDGTFSAENTAVT